MTMPRRQDGAPWRNFYGRRRGKALRPGQLRHLQQDLPRFSVPNVGWADNPDRTPIELTSLFGGLTQIHLEIGFGSGEHLLALAERNPQTGFLGCEPFVNGVATLLPRLVERSISNLRVHPGDARDLLDVLPAASIGRCYLLYPDPWPKKRHHSRRFFNADNLGALARILSPGAELRVATDIPDYVRHCLELLPMGTAFEWTARRPQDWRTPWRHWTGTRYEAKALAEGRAPHYLVIRRV